MEYVVPNNKFKKLFERSILVCQLESHNRDRDIAYNFIKNIAIRYTNFTIGCPIESGVYSLRNFKFDSKMFPPMLKIESINITLKAEYCSGKKWKYNDPSCFLRVFLRFRYLK